MGQHPPRGSVFVSYRRQDDPHVAGRLADRLGATIGPENVFVDVDRIEPGLDFAETIGRALDGCSVLLAMIGPTWLASSDEHGNRRLDEPDDFVRIEIATALERGVRVIPVLVDGAELPRHAELPAVLRPLLGRQYIRIDHDTFGIDVQRLVTTVDTVVSGDSPTKKGSVVTADRPSTLDELAELAATGRRAQAVDGYVRLVRDGNPVTAGSAALELGRLQLLDGERVEGLRMLRVAVDTGDPSVSGAAAFELGRAHVEWFNASAARFYLDRAAGSPESDVRTKALHNLIVLADWADDPDRIEELAQRVIDAANASLWPGTAQLAAGLLASRGRVVAATRLLRRVVEEAPPPGAASAAKVLGQLAAQQGDPEEAGRMYSRAAGSPTRSLAADARRRLAGMLRDTGQLDRARATYREAIDTDHPRQSARAANELAALELAAGNPDAAIGAVQGALHGTDPDQAAQAGLLMAEAEADRGDLRAASAAYRQVVVAGRPGHAGRAVRGLGQLAVRRNDLDGVRSAVDEAIRIGHRSESPQTCVELGRLLAAAGDVASAHVALTHASDSGHYRWAPEADIALARLQRRENDMAGAVRTCNRLLAARSWPASTRAATLLGDIMADLGHQDRAIDAYRRALTDRTRERCQAGIRLARLLERTDQAAAREVLEDVRDGPGGGAPEVRAEIVLRLGAVLDQTSRVEEAEACFREVTQFAHLRESGLAWLRIAGMRAGDGDVAGAQEAFDEVLRGPHTSLHATAEARRAELAGLGSVPSDGETSPA